MDVDLSRSIGHCFHEALRRAKSLRESGRPGEAAAVYREAGRLSQQLAHYSVGDAEKSRRAEHARELEKLADSIGRESTHGSRVAEEQGGENAELQAQIEALITRTNVIWDDIGGLSDTKRAIQLAFGIAVARKPEGVTMDVVGNILLYGPPGTGKSLLAAAVSNGLQATFFNVSAAHLLSKWFGESSRLIAMLFATARRLAPSVLFIDELESLFPSRDRATTGAEHRVLSALLTELSGLATAGRSPPVFTIGATNAPWLMDSAALSRFGRKIYVPLPDREARRAVLQIHLVKKGHTPGFPMEVLIDSSEGFSGRQLAHVAAAALERMVARCNPELADLVARGNRDLREHRIRVAPLAWSDFEPVLAGLKPDTSPKEVAHFQAW